MGTQSSARYGKGWVGLLADIREVKSEGNPGLVEPVEARSPAKKLQVDNYLVVSGACSFVICMVRSTGVSCKMKWMHRRDGVTPEACGV